MRLVGGCWLVLLCLFVYSAVPATAQLTANCSPGCYGPGIGSDGLANTTVGPNGNTVSYRFRAGHTGLLEKIHIYLIPDRSGYAAGTGGKIQITVNADDDTAAHNPSPVVLASYLLADPLNATPSRYFPIIPFTAPPSLAAGRLYHIVFKNVDTNSSANYLSVDALYLSKPTTPAQPTITDINGAQLLRTNSLNWAPRKGYLPILQLDFKDGWTEGTGYMEVWIGAPQAISGSAAIREQFTVTGEQKDVRSIAVRVARISGSDPLKVRLQDASGSLIEEGNIAAASIPSSTSPSYVWAEYKFTSIRSLLPGKTYFIELGAASSSTYQAFPIRKGNTYNFGKATYFSDGFAQFRQGATWTGWTQWGVTNRLDSDLQFYFEVAGIGAKAAISDVTANTTTTTATVTWNTDQNSSSQVEHGTSTTYGSMTSLNTAMVTSHSQAIAGLVPGTLYHYRVRSATASGTVAVSADFTFTTDAVAPAISDVAAGSLTSTSAIVSWLTDQAADGQVEYGTTTAYGSSTTFNPTLATSHAQVLSGLATGTLYHYRVRSSNDSGKLGVSSDATFTTLSVPPVISQSVAGSITSTSAKVSWITDQVANSQVEFGLTTAYGSLTALNPAMATNHAESLSGLSAGTLYHYRVRSTNGWGDQAFSPDSTFTTTSAPIANPAVAVINCSAGCYGSGLAADSLSSSVVGGPGANVVAYRFRAQRSGALDRIHFYMLPDVAGYSGGTGGKLQITVQADDGTPAHNPSGVALAASTLSNPTAATPSKYFPIVSFGPSPVLASGQLYHIVFANVDANPSSNYLSISSLYQSAAPSPAQPLISDTDSAHLLKTTGNAWTPRKGYTPILQLDYKDGTNQGTGYMEVWVGAPRSISGTNGVRQTFTVTGTQKTVKSVAVRVARLSGVDAMTLRLEDENGNLIEQRNIPASSMPVTNPASYSWVGFTFSSPRALLPGKTYRLVLQAPSSSVYQAYPMRKGLAYNFQNTTYFADGYAQFKTSARSWAGWTQWGVVNRTDSDLQFYFGF